MNPAMPSAADIELSHSAEVSAEATPMGATDDTALDDFMRALREDGQPRPGDVYGAFTIRRLLRAGGMGEAYLAVQAPFDRLTVVKVIRGVGAEWDRDRFCNEWKVGGELHHTNLVPVYAAGCKGNRDYYVMPYIRGGNLHEFVRAVKEWAAAPTGEALDIQNLVVKLADAKDKSHLRPWETLKPTVKPRPAPATAAARKLPHYYYVWVARRLIETASALATAHRAGVLHLDVKLSNILIETPSDIAKVLDFGLAQSYQKTADRESQRVECDPARVPPYAAPEVLQGWADARADVHGLGACLYELITLRKPAEENTSPAPSDLAAVAKKALAANPDERYPSAEAFADDLQRWLDRRPPKARNRLLDLPRSLWLWVRRNVAWAVSGLVVMFMILGASGLAFERAERGRREAEKENKRLALERRFEKALLESQSAATKSPVDVGWPRKVQKKLAEVLEIRPDADVKDHAAATLIGLDATHIYEEPAPPVEGQYGGFSSVAFSPDGKKLVASGWRQPDDPRVPGSAGVVWDGNLANRPVASRRRGTGPVAYPDADSPLQLLVTYFPQKSLPLWNVEKNVIEVELPLTVAGTVTRAALSADGRFAAATYYPMMRLPFWVPVPFTILWDIDRKPGVTTARRLHEWPLVSSALAFSPDGKVLATGTNMGEVVVRTTVDGVELQRFLEGDLAISGLAFGRNYRRPSGKRSEKLDAASGYLLAVGSKGGALSVWNLRTKSKANSFYGSEHAVFGVAFSPDGTTLASTGRTSPFLWDVGTGRALLRISPNGNGFLHNWTEGVAFSPTGDRLAFGSGMLAAFGPGGLDVFRIDDNRGVRTYRGLSGVVEKLWLSPKGKWVAALSQNWQLGVWNRATGEAKYIWDVPEGMTADNASAAFEGDDESILFASGTTATRWSLTTGERSDVWHLPMGLNDSLIARPGKKPLLIRRDPIRVKSEAIRARELGPKGEMTEVYKLEVPAVSSTSNLLFSTDGRFILVNSDQPPARLYDGQTGKLISLEATGLATTNWAGSLTDSGTVLTLIENVDRESHHHRYRLPDLTPLGRDPQRFTQIDDAGKLGLHAPRTSEEGVSLYRVGEEEAILAFDVGHQRYYLNSMRLSPDSRFIIWGRRDGTVCVADINKCLEALKPFIRP